jgi:two-component system sensor histidine kinase SenX3
VVELATVPSGADRPTVAGVGSAPAHSVASLSTAVVEAMSVGVVVLDSQDRVVLANPAAVEMNAASAATDGTLAAVPDLVSLARTCRNSGQEGEAELRLARPVPAPLRRAPRDLEARAARVIARPVGSDGTVALLLEDLTEQMRVDAVRRDFVANVSHELKTPVGALQLLAETIAECSDDPDTVRRFAARMSTESQRLSTLVQELIDLSRLQGAEPMAGHEVISLAVAAAEAVDRVRLAADAKEIQLSVTADPAIAVQGDMRQLVMAVSNLLENAIAYSPPRTNVKVTVQRRGDSVELLVQDEGIGIPKKHQERIFERFFRVDPARSRMTGGTGLGLSIVKHVATNHGGLVSVWSVEGAGSTFTLSLPTSVLRSGSSPETALTEDPPNAPNDEENG